MRNEIASVRGIKSAQHARQHLIYKINKYCHVKPIMHFCFCTSLPGETQSANIEIRRILKFVRWHHRKNIFNFQMIFLLTLQRERKFKFEQIASILSTCGHVFAVNQRELFIMKINISLLCPGVAKISFINISLALLPNIRESPTKI